MKTHCHLWMMLGFALTLTACEGRQAPAVDPVDARPADARLVDADISPDGTPDPDAGRPGPDMGPAEDGAPRDRGIPGDASVDADPPLPFPDMGPDEATHFIDRGRCYAHTPRCAEDAHCPAPTYLGCDLGAGRCRLDQPCGCVTDDDCAPDDLCIINERVCGECVPPPSPCADGMCPGEAHCVDDLCQEACPGIDPGPPADCSGEPPLGRCSGRWAYLPESAACVQVNDVACAGSNTFDDPTECIATCRAPATCTVSITALDGVGTEMVDCALAPGPGACVALAYCACRLTLPGAGQAELANCAMAETNPRALQNLSDVCPGRTIAEMLRQTEGRPPLTMGSFEMQASAGCEAIVGDQTWAPTCFDGVQNGWEQGVDCGALDCPDCP